MVDENLRGRRGFSGLSSADSNVESGIIRIHRGFETVGLDIERNTGDSDDYDHQGRPGRKFWKLHMRPPDDDLPQDWWFASTAIPLLAATIGPLANVLSIAAIVTQWRVTLPDNGQLPLGKDENGVGIKDPHWEIVLNSISLGCGFAGNFALLLNFTRRIRYIIALPLSIIFWYFATGILIGITVAMNQYAAPVRPGETYSQGYWHAIIAAVLYLFGSMILMINMLGYFLGHYPQHFDLDDDQRTLILQTMMFFLWLAGGAGVFHAVCGFSFVDALYFCDVTVLTVGFGDFVANNDVSRGLIFPYSVGGIIFLGLMINSIHNFAVGMSRDKFIKAHQRRVRKRTVGRTVTSEKELRTRLGLPPRRSSEIPRSATTLNGNIARSQTRVPGKSLSEFGSWEKNGSFVEFHGNTSENGSKRGKQSQKRIPLLPLHRNPKVHTTNNNQVIIEKPFSKREKLLMLREEKDRFDAMRKIQQDTHKFKRYFSLSISIFAFGILWCIGALVFYYAEKRQQNMSYFEALYFCYVSLLTIGYGDFSPQSNAGKPFFVVWSLVAIPTMTILISDMGDTVISAIKRGTFTLGDWTVLPRAGVWHDFLEKHPRLRDWLIKKEREREEQKRIAKGFEVQTPDDYDNPLGTKDRPLTLEELAKDGSTDHDLARKLAVAIKTVANDLKHDPPKRYRYEEWVEFTRLIRFSSGREELEVVEEEEGTVEWDWIGEDSPMLADETEAQWVLDRLCESLNRYTRRQARMAVDVDGRRLGSSASHTLRSDSSFSKENSRSLRNAANGEFYLSSALGGVREMSDRGGMEEIDPVMLVEERDQRLDGDPDTRI